MPYLLALDEGIALKTGILLLVVCVILPAALRADEPTYRRVVFERQDPLEGVLLTKDWSPFRLKETNLAAVLDVRIDAHKQRGGITYRMSEQIDEIDRGVNHLRMDDVGKLQLFYREPRTSRNHSVYLRVAEVNQSPLLEYDPDITRGSQFRAFQDDKKSGQTNAWITKTVIFEYVNNYQLPTELYITLQMENKRDISEDKKSKLLSLGKKEEAAVFQILSSIPIDK